MESTLKSLFEYQKFENRPSLQRIIDSVHARYAACELSDDEAELVNAAGSPQLERPKTDLEGNQK